MIIAFWYLFRSNGDLFKHILISLLLINCFICSKCFIIFSTFNAFNLCWCLLNLIIIFIFNQFYTIINVFIFIFRLSFFILFSFCIQWFKILITLINIFRFFKSVVIIKMIKWLRSSSFNFFSFGNNLQRLYIWIIKAAWTTFIWTFWIGWVCWIRWALWRVRAATWAGRINCDGQNLIAIIL